MNITPPSIGRIVIYTSPKGTLVEDRCAALIHKVYTDHVRTEKDVVDLTLFTSHGIQYRSCIPWAKFTFIKDSGNTWDWPQDVVDRTAVMGTEGPLAVEDETDETPNKNPAHGDPGDQSFPGGSPHPTETEES